MCLALPALVTAIHDDGTATVSLDGVKKRIQLVLVDGVAVGDYVVVHTGYALTRVDPRRAEETLALFERGGRREEEGS